ncbi:GNAT family N-acetyltransferase [Salinisphaera hydrothermalis]|uniref:Phosphinothricin acetyltransferase n=1 Tax=Salinisphaera hydrothermalis (strain C41B8) TaxID=1304275 RepID=A0A084IQK9_SALHC|nr:GNAT family N-acetyltransferase [Salinisphaera hydrothermalis]KEZ78993.1 phosphinothricin acetyltransferase [Salinisphaera hydrothermalis C41B8]
MTSVSPPERATTTIRRVRPTDGPALSAIYAPFVTDSAISFEYEAPDGDTMAQRALVIDATHAWLVAECNGQCLGYAYAGEFRSREAYRGTVEVSVYLHQAARGRSLGARLYHALFAILADQGRRMAIAVVTVPNPVSVRFHEQLGFRRIGVIEAAGYKFGRAHDVAYYQREIGQDGRDCS